MALPDRFIDGVSDYCDRWCERCPLTARCRLFAVERRLNELGPDADNAAFWAALGVVLPEDDDDDDDADDAADAFTPEPQETWRPASSLERERHPLAEAAMSLGMDMHRWLRAQGEIGSLPRRTGDISPAEALEVLNWYCLQIGVKLSRALSRWPGGDEEPWSVEPTWRIDAEEDEIEQAIDESARADRAGSAKVTLIGIERSLGAWTILRNAVPDRDAEIVLFQRRLARLRRQIDELIPEARTFVRPGFDDGTLS